MASRRKIGRRRRQGCSRNPGVYFYLMAEIVIMVDETWVCLGTVSDGNWPGKGEMSRKERKHLGCLRYV